MIFVDTNVPMYLVGAHHMRSNRVTRMLSFDRGFDAVPEIKRLY